MHGHGVLEIVIIFLAAAVIAVPLSRKLGLGAVLGYLCAGVIIGPQALGLVADAEQTLAASEFGVVLMLFIIGLELSPARLWVMRRLVFGFGAMQVLVSALLLGSVLLWLGIDWRAAVIIGLGLALSSTAVGLQLLAERKEMTAPHGRLGFGILLFQDLAAIPLLATIPLLGVAGAANEGDAGAGALRALLAIAALVIGGRYLLRPVFRVVARSGAVEVFTATALLVVVASAWLMQQAGLSMGLGAFLAGLLLADSEFRHELESQIDPFRGLLQRTAEIGGHSDRRTLQSQHDSPQMSRAVACRQIVFNLHVKPRQADGISLHRQEVAECGRQRSGVIEFGIGQGAVPHRPTGIDKQVAAQVCLVFVSLDVIAVTAGIQPPVEVAGVIAGDILPILSELH